MSDTFLLQTLPVAAFVRSGNTISLTDLLEDSFGAFASNITSIRIVVDSAASFASNNFSYWDPGTPVMDAVLNNGADIGSTSGITYSASDIANLGPRSPSVCRRITRNTDSGGSRSTAPRRRVGQRSF